MNSVSWNLGGVDEPHIYDEVGHSALCLDMYMHVVRGGAYILYTLLYNS